MESIHYKIRAYKNAHKARIQKMAFKALISGAFQKIPKAPDIKGFNFNQKGEEINDVS
jgi:hypothetical protein